MYTPIPTETLHELEAIDALVVRKRNTNPSLSDDTIYALLEKELKDQAASLDHFSEMPDTLKSNPFKDFAYAPSTKKQKQSVPLHVTSLSNNVMACTTTHVKASSPKKRKAASLPLSAPKKIHKSPEPESQPSFPKEELAYFDPSAQVVPPSIVDQHIHDSIKAYNQLVKSFMKKEDDSNRFSGVELVHNKKKRDHVKCYKNGPAGPGWGGGKITLSMAGHKSLMGTEAAGGSDLLLHLNDDLLKQKVTLHEKIAYLERLKSQDLPKYALFEGKSISGNIFHGR